MYQRTTRRNRTRISLKRSRGKWRAAVLGSVHCPGQRIKEFEIIRSMFLTLARIYTMTEQTSSCLKVFHQASGSHIPPPTSRRSRNKQHVVLRVLGKGTTFEDATLAECMSLVFLHAYQVKLLYANQVHVVVFLSARATLCSLLHVRRCVPYCTCDVYEVLLTP